MDGVELAHLARIGFLAQLAEEIARRRAGGHLTLLRFSSGWKVAVGTPDLDSGAGRHEMAALPTHPTLEAALEALVIGVPEIPEGRYRRHSCALGGRRASHAGSRGSQPRHR